jgi:hypothetical protein
MPKIEVFYLFKIIKLAERSETIILGTLGILVHFRHLKSDHPPHQYNQRLTPVNFWLTEAGLSPGLDKIVLYKWVLMHKFDSTQLDI